jgi:hypothetical protein
VLASSFDLPKGLGTTAPQLDGNIVNVTHWEKSPVNPDKVRFFVDRVDISTPAAPKLVGSINTPGSLFKLDSDVGRMVTIDYRREVFQDLDWQHCYEKGGYLDYSKGYQSGYYDADGGVYVEPKYDCLVYHRIFRLLSVDGTNATLLSSLELDNVRLGSMAPGFDRIFIQKASPYYYYYNGSDQPQEKPQLLTITGTRGDELKEATRFEYDGDWWFELKGAGTKAVMVGSYPSKVRVIETADPSAPQQTSSTDLFSYAYDVQILGDKAICTLGSYGVQTVPLQ